MAFRSALFTRNAITHAIGVLLALASTANAAETVTLKIATSDVYGVANTFPAHGDDKVEGVSFENFRFTGGVTDMLAALRAGQIDVAEVGAAGPVVAQAAGTSFKIIAVTQPWPKGEAIIVAQDSPIKTIEDLRGKKVAYSRATNAQWLVVSALRSKGLSLKDVESTFLPPGTNLLNALKAGVIDATAYIDVPLANYEAQGARRIADHGDIGFPIALQFLASDDAIKNKKAAVAAYVRQLAKHLAWAHEHPKDRAEAVANILHLDPAIVLTAEQRRPPGLRAIDDVIVKSNQEISDAFFAEGVIPQKLNVEAVFTTEFNKDILR
jgi:aliphatic sulfonates family ABC transporter substrate-binding protein